MFGPLLARMLKRCFRLVDPTSVPAPKDAHPAWGLVGGQGFTKVRSTEADHVGPASGPKRYKRKNQ